jgi:uncharacterized protein (TIGR00245 family)
VSTIQVTLGEVAASLALVAVAVAVSFWRRAELEHDIAVAVLRSFIQLTAVGYVIQAIFDTDSLWLVVALLAGMVAFGAWTARGRAKAVPGVTGPITLGLAVAAAVTLGLVLALRIFKAEPRYLVPVGGMVIGNSMTAVAVALNRLADEMHEGRRQIEAMLALGATSFQAARGAVEPDRRLAGVPGVLHPRASASRIVIRSSRGEAHPHTGTIRPGRSIASRQTSRAASREVSAPMRSATQLAAAVDTSDSISTNPG